MILKAVREKNGASLQYIFQDPEMAQRRGGTTTGPKVIKN
jgi:hypothetical protein